MPLDSPMPVSLWELLRSSSRLNPDADALLAPDCRSLTYGQLSDQVKYVGQSLRGLGIERSARVAVVLPNGPEMAAAFLGIAAHAACAPLNPSYRPDNFEFYLTDLGAKAIVVPADTNLAARTVATQLGLTVIEIEPSPTRLAGGFRVRGNPARLQGPPDWGRNEDIALVLHTSGTTSRPKQVPLTHLNLCSSARNIAGVLGLSPKDRCQNVMPLFHIHGLVGVFLASIFAAGSVVCSSGYEQGSFARLLRDFEPTWYSAVPTIHQSVVALAKEQPAFARSTHLRLIRSSSSALPPKVMAELEQTFGVPVIESYGMTEAAHQMASNPLPPAVRKPGSVGLPAGPEMAIMDEEGQLLPAGATGEIVIRGTNVTGGYANNPQANEAAYTKGWFRTGDRGYTDDDGYFYVTGRTKEMINRGGEKLSPREIDEVLLAHPGVAQAVTFAVPHRSLGEDIAAAVVLQKGANVSESDLREFAFSRLAAFKVPSQIVFLNALPQGPTGKLQRIGLHEHLQDQLRREHVPPRTEMEGILAGLWREVLTIDEIGVHDNFFGSGGDSLAAGRLVGRINTRFELNLAVSSVFRAPSIEAQAIVVESALLDQLDSD